jgi:uncharacterized RDD family membrane protein YckC
MEQNIIYYQMFGLFVAVFISCAAWSHYSETSFFLSSRYRTFQPRFWAGYVDSAVLGPISIFIFFVASRELPPPIGLLLWFFASFYYYAYSIGLHARYGQTVGKMVCKVKVIDCKTEERIGWRQALLRDSVPLLVTVIVFAQELSLIYGGELKAVDLIHRPDPQRSFGTYDEFVAWTLFIWFCAELVTMLTNKRRRAIHDFIAGTVVVRTSIQAEEEADRQADLANTVV